MCVPVLSHNSPSNNVLLKITVPKRTGRKRKRGSDESFTYPNGQTLPSDGNEDAPCDEDVEVLSKYRMDKPAAILRKIRDNRDNYQVEAVAEIRQSHRYRGNLKGVST
jgi:general transcription factor 3C polypeptide 5 (transcription factor C subunit 1)